MTRKRLLALVAAIALCLPAAAAERVVLLSVDGLRPDLYLDPAAHGAELPAFRALMREGAYAEAVEGIFPTVTYPSHTTIATGVVPGKHGILDNYVLDESGRFEDWYWRSSAIRVKALWDVARGETAAIHWPVTAGADIDFDFPEFWIPGSDRPWPEVMKETASPALLDEIGPLPDVAPEEETEEDFVFRTAELVLEKHRPELLMLHVANTDSKQHRYGREHREVAAAFERVDRALAHLRGKLESLGLAGETLLVVTGDHGFIDTHTEIHMNALLKKEGFLDLAPDGTVRSFRALAWPAGGSCALVLKDPADADTAARLSKWIDGMLEGPLGEVMTKVGREELDRLGAFPGALFALEAEEGYYFGKNREGELLTAGADLGYHGYLPRRPEMRTGFLMAGPRVRHGVRIPRMRQVDIAPTIAYWAGWDLGPVDGLALRGLFEERQP
jgi:predicted AlkP superfamily pyrophosphatase or phosphodiesterase